MNATYVLGYRWLPSSRINKNVMIEVVRRQPIGAMIKSNDEFFSFCGVITL
jgi:hypothetical protein